MTPEISLIMPVWRPRPDWLCAAVESALGDAADDLELIVVDDGCEEPVAPLLSSVRDPRMRVVRIEHAGAYAARNAGVRLARGAFIRFVDADDIVEPHSIARLRALADERTISYGATLVCDESLTPGELVTSGLEGDVASDCLRGGFEVFVVSILFPRAVIDSAGPWNEDGFRVSGDWDFVLRAVEQAPVRPLSEVVSRYRRHADSITRTASIAAGAAAGEKVLAGYFARHPELRGSALEREAYMRLHLERARDHAWASEWRSAATQYARALRRSPMTAAAHGARWARSRLRRRRRLF